MDRFSDRDVQFSLHLRKLYKLAVYKYRKHIQLYPMWRGRVLNNFRSR